VASERFDALQRLVEIWNSGDLDGFLLHPRDGQDDIPVDDFTMVAWFEGEDPSRLTAGSPSSTGRGPWRRPEPELADSPVKRCMLRATRLGCLKKPTEEARGG
jgi:hypothetical protein